MICAGSIGTLLSEHSYELFCMFDHFVSVELYAFKIASISMSGCSFKALETL